MSLRQPLVLSLLCLLLLVYAGLASAADYQWTNQSSSIRFFSSATSACYDAAARAYQPSSTVQFDGLQAVSETIFYCKIKLCSTSTGTCSPPNPAYVVPYSGTRLEARRSGTSCPSGTTYDSTNGSCVAPTCPGSGTWNQSTQSCELNCSSPQYADPETWSCITPPSCPGGFFDYDSKTCAYAQDDACSSIGATWSPDQNSCVCSGGKTPITSGGVMTCSGLPSQDPCNKDSPDFAGYQGTTPMCFGKARCPDGGQPGYVGQGDTAQFVCYPAPTNDPNCNGSVGVVNGEKVCVPSPGKDPDFPDCKGVVGTFNGQKQCIEDATNDSRCAAGETAGYTGTGSNMKFVCIPSNYKPQTCPAGQYVWNTQTGGFGCVTLSSQPPSDAGKTPGAGSGSSSTTVKDAAGNTTGTEETESEFKIDGLFHDAPTNDYQEKLTAFGADALSKGVDADSLLREFDGQDGAFTERNKLDDLSGFVKTHTIGNNAGCSGNFPFFGYSIQCDKFQTYSRILGWFIFVLTMINIYQLIMAKSESGV